MAHNTTINPVALELIEDSSIIHYRGRRIPEVCIKALLLAIESPLNNRYRNALNWHRRHREQQWRYKRLNG